MPPTTTDVTPFMKETTQAFPMDLVHAHHVFIPCSDYIIHGEPG